MVAQLVQDLFHLEGRKDRFDQDRSANRPSRGSELVLCEVENVVPEPRLEMAFELREVEVRAAALLQETLDVVKEVEAEVEEAAGDRLAVDLDVSLVEGPSTCPHRARRHQELRRLACVESRLALISQSKQLLTPAGKLALQLGDECERLRGQDLAPPAFHVAFELDVLGGGHRNQSTVGSYWPVNRSTIGESSSALSPGRITCEKP